MADAWTYPGVWDGTYKLTFKVFRNMTADRTTVLGLDAEKRMAPI
jgi:hypothetical protein